MKFFRSAFVIAASLLTVFVADSTAEAKKSKSRDVEAAFLNEENLSDEALNAKLVVGEPPMTEAAPEPQAEMTHDPLLAPHEAAAEPVAVKKIDTNKLPESEIPVLATAKDSKKPSGNNLHRILMTLVVLTGVLGGALLAIKKWGAKKSGQKQNTRIKILAQHHLAPKKSLMIVQVAGESILIGVTDQNISMLKTLSLIDDEIPESVPRSFDGALDGFDEADEEHEAGGRDGFAVRGISEIRDTVSKRFRNM